MVDSKAVVIVADPDGGRVWAYVCRRCKRIARPYYVEPTLAASRHDCENPRSFERVKVLGSDPTHAGLVAAAWAALLDDWTPA